METANNTFDEQTDFIVVGTGGGALCGALTMLSQGNQVIVLEKSSLVGGTTARSGGVMWIPNNRFLLRDGLDESEERARTYLEALCGEQQNTPGSTPLRRQTYITRAAQMLEFLLQQGIDIDRYRYWPDYYDELPGGLSVGRSVGAKLFDINQLGEWKQRMVPGFMPYPAMVDEAMQMPYFKRSPKAFWLCVKMVGRALYAKLTGKHYVSAGAALQARQLHALLRMEADLRTDSPVSSLIEQNSQIVGVVTVKDGKPWRIGARLGVLVGAGGFAHNQSMRDQYLPGTSDLWTSAAPTDTGEMIQEMARHGAQLAQMDEMVGNQCTLPPGSKRGDIRATAQSITAKPHAILVDQTGVRYMNEGGSYMAFCKGMLQRNQAEAAVPSWGIFDSRYLKKYMFAGIMPGGKIPQEWFDSGYLKKADSLAELASLLDLSPDTLQATVERFNGFVAKNHDDDFQRGERAYDRWLGDPLHKPNPTLGTLEKGPFYAFPVVPGDVGTYGGVVTDEHARVLRADGSVIAGLYATGVSTASVMGRYYPGAGSSVGPSMTWGYVAARHAAEKDA
ncbi:FAD-binding protein [Pseudomaricurvus sp. HS19]|uniref:FAD-binding protein n=1 Tax=Pseudomaricurvus sp. HS19 TaxID=2692626 RepID=UPI0013696629|nr:FAD-binding protein [Pseudomaricurvus sp. HS19]